MIRQYANTTHDQATRTHTRECKKAECKNRSKQQKTEIQNAECKDKKIAENRKHIKKSQRTIKQHANTTHDQATRTHAQRMTHIQKCKMRKQKQISITENRNK